MGLDFPFYRVNGYAHVPRVFSPEEVVALRNTCDDFREDSPTWTGPWLADRNIAMTTRHNVHRLEPWPHAVTKPALLEAVSAAMGGKVPALASSTYICKPPSNGQPFPLHQDSAYYAQEEPDYVIVTVYLDDCTEDNGPIRFLPGSHGQGHLEHTRAGANKWYLPLDQYRLEDTVAVLAKAGDVSLCSIYMVHGSLPNRSNQPRRTVRLGYRPA